MKEMDSKYHVGDKVRIVGTYIDIDTGNVERDRYAGECATIRKVEWCNMCHRYEYRIDESSLLWCNDNFEFDIQNELPEFDASGANVLDLFS